MICTEKQKLIAKESCYVSIGITEDGLLRTAISIPWEKTAHAFNMKLPDVYLEPNDLFDDEVMNLLSDFTVIGCYIWASLESYDFLSNFPSIRDLSIRNANALRTLDFLSYLKECRMMYLHRANLQSLNEIWAANRESRHSPLCGLHCVALCQCRVDDLIPPHAGECYFSEFLIWENKEFANHERWNGVPAATFRYTECDE